MNELLIRPMEELDLPQAAAIEKEAITPPWSEQAFRESLGLEHTILLAAIQDGQVAGYCVCYQSFEEGEITNVAVKKELRGQGIAGKLLEAPVFIWKGARRGTLYSGSTCRQRTGPAFI